MRRTLDHVREMHWTRQVIVRSNKYELAHSQSLSPGITNDMLLGLPFKLFASLEFALEEGL